MNSFNADLGARVRKTRESRGLTREKLAEAADIDTKFLYEIETGKKGMSAKTLTSIALALNVSLDAIALGK